VANSEISKPIHIKNSTFENFDQVFLCTLMSILTRNPGKKPLIDEQRIPIGDGRQQVTRAFTMTRTRDLSISAARALIKSGLKFFQKLQTTRSSPSRDSHFPNSTQRFMTAQTLSFILRSGLQSSQCHAPSDLAAS
jgi:hypothetical protein